MIIGADVPNNWSAPNSSFKPLSSLSKCGFWRPIVQNISLKSAVAGLFLIGSMSIAHAAGGGMEAHTGLSQMRGYTAQVSSGQLDMGRSVSTGKVGSTTCQLPEPSISPNGIASLSQMTACR